MIRIRNRFNTPDFIQNLFNEARSQSGTWSSVTIYDLQLNQELFTEKDIYYIVETGCMIISSKEEELTTKFKIAQLFSQLYNMKFPYFNEIFLKYADLLHSFMDNSQKSYLWKPTVRLLENIIFHLKPQKSLSFGTFSN